MNIKLTRQHTGGDQNILHLILVLIKVTRQKQMNNLSIKYVEIIKISIIRVPHRYC